MHVKYFSKAVEMKLNIDRAAFIGHLQEQKANKASKVLINGLLTSHKILSEQQ